MSDLESRYIVNVVRPRSADGVWGAKDAMRTHFFRVEVPMYSGTEDALKLMIRGFKKQWPDAEIDISKWEISGVPVKVGDL